MKKVKFKAIVDKNKNTSLRKIITGMLLLIIPVIIVSTAFIAYSLVSSYKDNEEHFVFNIQSFSDEAEELLMQMNYYLVYTLFDSNYIEIINDPDTILKGNNAGRSLYSELNSQKNFWTFDFNTMYYSNNSKMTITRFSGSSEYIDNMYIKNHLTDEIENGGNIINTLNWTPIKVGNRLYVYQLYNNGPHFMASWVLCDNLFSKINTNALSEDGSLYYLGTDSIPLVDYETDTGNAETAEQLPAQGMSTEYEIKRLNLTLLATDKNSINLNNISMLLTFITIVMIIIIIVCFYTLSYYRRYIEVPLETISQHIGSYSEIRANRKAIGMAGGFSELNYAAEAFDNLTEQLRELKIDIYEEKLSVAKAQLEYYQLQIKPHFFVNCFSIIFAMAQKGDFERIQNFCIKLSNYVRYLLSDSLTMIPLSTEINMMHEFLDIQKIRNRSNSSMYESIDKALLDTEIPPLAILTFVENSVKHGTGSINDPIEISVDISRIKGADGCDKIFLVIEDDGVGLPEEVREFYNSSTKPKEDWKWGEHIGIRNIVMRFYLLYGENFTLNFPRTEHGTRVELTIPITATNTPEEEKKLPYNM